jgi:transposase-like protein
MAERRRHGRYPDEVRDRADRMVFEHQAEYPSQWKAIESISGKLGINHETLRIWLRWAETDAGQRPGLTTDERKQLRELQRERKSSGERTKSSSLQRLSSGRSSTADR